MIDKLRDKMLKLPLIIKQNLCFLVFGFIAGSFMTSLLQVIILIVLFNVSVVLIEFKNKNESDIFRNTFLDNLYIIITAVSFSVLNLDILQTLFYGIFIILTVNLRTHSLN